MIEINKTVRIIFLLLPAFFSALPDSQAQLKLATVFADHMVLQRDMNVPVWGSAKPGDKITVRFNNNKAEATADAAGNWKTYLRPMQANAIARELVVSVGGRDIVTVKDVLVGEVWLCSGQSNMRMEMMYRDKAIAGVINWQQEVRHADYPMIRFYNRFRKKGASLWEVCDSGSVKLFSAVAYYFGLGIFSKQRVPVGLVHESAGGTSIQKWIPEPYFKELPWAQQYLHYSQYAPWADPGSCYKSFIAPLAGFAIRGAIWYQGESNANFDVHGYSYRYMLPLLIRSWRKEWGQGDFPFAFVQLPVWDNSKAFRYVREAELNTVKTVSNTGMVVSYDNVLQRDVLHPGTKKHIGERLAYWANSTVYDHQAAIASPLYEKYEKKENGITISFQYAEGLKSSDGKALSGFEIAATDGNFKPAKAVVASKNSVTVSNDAVKEPVAVRYAWGENIQPGNLVNEAGLPASPFRTDAWGNDTLEKALMEGKELQLVKMNGQWKADAKDVNDWLPANQPASSSLKNNKQTVALSTNRPGRGGLQSPWLLQVDFSRRPVIRLHNLQLGSAQGWTLLLMTPLREQFILQENATETGEVVVDITGNIRKGQKQHLPDMDGPNDIVIFFYANSDKPKASLDIDSIEVIYETN